MPEREVRVKSGLRVMPKDQGSPPMAPKDGSKGPLVSVSYLDTFLTIHSCSKTTRLKEGRQGLAFNFKMV